MINFTNKNKYSRFDTQFPVYNWVYPILTNKSAGIRSEDIYSEISLDNVHSRALYVHIPFCDTICHFCLLSKGVGHEGDQKIEDYVQALLIEFELKAKHTNLTAMKIDSIFFGGGTPSIFSAEQIYRIGKKIRECFILTPDTEYVWEIELKSISDEKCVAIREIGGNSIRFGVQSMVEKFRRYFNITVSLEETFRKVEMIKKHFEHTSMDLIYGMHGQSEDDLIQDLEASIALGTHAIDCYRSRSVRPKEL